MTFVANLDLPTNTGKIVKVEWDFEDKGKFEKGNFKKDKNNNFFSKGKHRFSKPGTYFTTVRVTSQRDGDKKTPFTLIRNLDRVRVVVK